jgi:hypothetical protein
MSETTCNWCERPLAPEAWERAETDEQQNGYCWGPGDALCDEIHGEIVGRAFGERDALRARVAELEAEVTLRRLDVADDLETVPCASCNRSLPCSECVQGCGSGAVRWLLVEVERLRQRLSERPKMLCIYCGYTTPLDRSDEEVADDIIGHMRVCERHPARVAEAQRDALAAESFASASLVTEHIRTCPQHPLAEALSALRKGLVEIGKGDQADDPDWTPETMVDALLDAWGTEREAKKQAEARVAELDRKRADDQCQTRRVVLPPPLRFDVDVAQAAADEWGFNCGPGALAALLGKTPDEIRPHLGDFERKRYLSPTMMADALRSLGVGFRRAYECAELVHNRRPPMPNFGLVRVQWDGPWCKPGVPMAARYGHTHWIATVNHLPTYSCAVFDINATCSGWIPWVEWAARLVPWLLKQTQPRATGEWWATQCWEIQGGPC